MRIVPAILTSSPEEFLTFLKKAEEFSPHNQIDITDGEFVPSLSITVPQLENLNYRVKSFVEAHLMVEEPLNWLKPFYEFGAERIIFHFEIRKDKEEIIREIRKLGLEAGLAINPSTQVKEFSHLVDKVDTILFMSVEPGFYGSKFIPDTLDKIREFKKFWPDKPIGIDGGINLSNLKEVVPLGIDFICVGSAIFKSKDPKKSYQELSSFQV
ncbi:MAG: ribulose-phosphate 3-epimerase [Candidatus Omnitrophota bacterium]|nr:MAG: ribulose-phosphate 3-epimerase [Candidatus Omnitrophota bacterium]